MTAVVKLRRLVAIEQFAFIMFLAKNNQSRFSKYIKLYICQKIANPMKSSKIVIPTYFFGNEILISFVPLNYTYSVSMYDLEVELSCCGKANIFQIKETHVCVLCY